MRGSPDIPPKHWQQWREIIRAVAVKAHEGQLDKSGEPYILHPLAVADRVRHLGPVREFVAYLHDVVEDTEYTLEMLEEELEGCPYLDDILAGVDGMTRREGEVYKNFIRRAAENPISKDVKRADIDHNTDPSRGWEMPSGLRKRYANAIAILEGFYDGRRV